VVANPAVRGSRSWWGAVAVDIGFIWVVPVFVMISGALILEPRQYARGTSDFYRRRLLRLAPALVFWSLFYFLVVRTWMSGAPITWDSIAGFLLDGRPYTHLYFLWLIIGLYAVAPVLSAFLRDGGARRAVIFAAIVLGATVFTGSSSAIMSALGQPRPLTLLALTQWLPYAGYFLAGWALRGKVLRGWRLAALMTVTAAAIVVCIVQYGSSPRNAFIDALAPVGYYGPLVALASLGVFVCANSVLSEWRPQPRAALILRELSDSAFGVFLLHFVMIIAVRMIPAFATAQESLLFSFIEWFIVVLISFIIVLALRRVPYLRRLV